MIANLLTSVIGKKLSLDPSYSLLITTVISSALVGFKYEWFTIDLQSYSSTITSIKGN